MLMVALLYEVVTESLFFFFFLEAKDFPVR